MAQHTEERIAHGALVFVAPHPVLAELARDLARGITDPAVMALPVDILVGLHRLRPRLPARGRRQLGIQTEQIRDAEGRPMWKKVRPGRLRKHLLACHRVLDLSVSNAPVYGLAGRLLRHRLDFGPYVFPQRIPDFVPGKEAVFFGAANDRRADLVARHGIRMLPNGVFGAALAAELAGAAAVVNLHYTEGVYTEAPRLLAACLAGKPVMSEPLAPPLVAGRHYLPLGPLPTQPDLAALQARFATEIAARHRFAEILLKMRRA